MLDLAHRLKRLDHTVYLNHDYRADLDCWKQFLPLWNGSASFLNPVWTPVSDMLLFTDAAGSIGCGGICGDAWFQLRWPEWVLRLNPPIAWLELVPVYLACVVWGSHWRGKRLQFYSDNQATVAVWKKFSSPHKGLLEIIRRIYFHAAKGNFTLRIQHIPGVANAIADSISRFQMDRFRELAHSAKTEPEPLDSNLTELSRSLHQSLNAPVGYLTEKSIDCSLPTWLQEPEELTEPEFDDFFLSA
ncbi:hypothetical protein RvY_18651 [Ramazzottius varieornatus]|uniref:Uncharacterized protein n=1 Tax=Ramazzottius varieornatus TaxID=947166 RepID=A0A1D1W6M7_RAMVA|nr:hypothetical protein RvY_18651 [Ramazzottius varieornatus]